RVQSCRSETRKIPGHSSDGASGGLDFPVTLFKTSFQTAVISTTASAERRPTETRISAVGSAPSRV
ncbi:MAG: hypothetical protein IKU90_00565, partial [Clostridia bacterium]|nr:hypothetical protein [Clostridia bacterium]